MLIFPDIVIYKKKNIFLYYKYVFKKNRSEKNILFLLTAKPTFQFIVLD